MDHLATFSSSSTKLDDGWTRLR